MQSLIQLLIFVKIYVLDLNCLLQVGHLLNQTVYLFFFRLTKQCVTLLFIDLSKVLDFFLCFFILFL